MLLISLGTAGDVHPFVGLGVALRERGHDVTLMVNSYFEPLARRHGLGFLPLGTVEDYFRIIENPDLWRPVRGPQLLARLVFESIAPQYEAIAGRCGSGNTVMIASGAAFAARIAHEVLGIPLITLILQPATLRSVYRPSVIAGFPSILTRLPSFVHHLLLRVLDVVTDRALFASRINAFRAQFGLSPVKRLMKDWWLSPKLGVCLFPDWYGMPQPDWPARVVMTGFPLFDESTPGELLPDNVRNVLSGGEAPIVFTPGSGMVHGRAFFTTAIQACQRLGRKGILLTRYHRQLPVKLPDGVIHAEYVPFSRLLPKAAALVHHGGVGTTAQALAAGVPQLIMPMTFDQPDNADRVKRLGVGDWLRPRAFRPVNVAQCLQRLIDSAEVAARCHELADRIKGVKSLAKVCDLIEQAADQPARTPRVQPAAHVKKE